MKYSIKTDTNLSEDSCNIELFSDKAIFKSESTEDAYFAVVIEFDNWVKDNYIFMPACVYNGNRFNSVKRQYPPMFIEEEWDENPNTIITDVPRLNLHGDSKIEVTTGDMATPAIGILSHDSNTAFLLFTKQGIGSRNFGITFEEKADKAFLTISYPVKREMQYLVGTLQKAKDKTLNVNKNQIIEIPFNIYEFKCESIRGLFKGFFNLRKKYSHETKKEFSIPFSEAWKIQEEKFNLLNYNKKGKYYKVGTNDSRYEDWQAGWVGGGMTSYALLAEGSKESKKRACNNLDFMCEMQSGAGFFYGMVHDGEIYGDGHNYPGTQNFHLIRKSADVLYFLFKHFDLFVKRGVEIEKEWIKAARKCSDAFVVLWDKYGQFGQYIDVETGDIIVGNSTAAGIAPGALALSYEFFGDERYLITAKKAAEQYYQKDVCNGCMTGGPGEILQCPDSESSFGLLESFVTIYEVTGDKKWVEYAKATAQQCASWCVNYRYEFPENSEFKRLDINTIGSVFANVQNKHSAPGICTLSGNSLLKLYRATGDIEYLLLMSDIAGFIVQCMSREDRPVCSNKKPLEPGFINERVNMSDWEGEGCVGEVFSGSCWSEVSQLLTYTEIPGVYAVPDKKILIVTDNVKAYYDNEERLVIENISGFDITVKVMREYSKDQNNILGITYEDKLIRVLLGPFESKTV